MKILFTICGRAGSKGCKNKNIREFLGKPLFEYTINAINLYRIKSGNDVDISVSTDSPEFITLLEKFGNSVFVINRDPSLAGDSTPKVPVIANAAQLTEISKKKEYDFVVDLDITSPIRTVEDIENAIKVFLSDNKYDCVFSVVKSRRNPYFNMVKSVDGEISKVLDSNYTARQQAPQMYDMNASIYVYRKSFLFKEGVRSPLNGINGIVEMYDTGIIDIDNEEDFELMECIAQYLIKNKKEYQEIFK